MTGFSLRPIVVLFLCLVVSFPKLAAQCISGTSISTESGETSVLTCPGDGRADLVVFKPNTFAFFYAYVLTNENNVILSYSTDAAINFEGASTQNFRVWGLSYSGNLTIDPGVKINAARLADGCYELSTNFVEVRRSIPSESTISMNNASPYLCPSTTENKVVTFSSTVPSSEQYAYLITNKSNKLIQVAQGNKFNFKNFPVNTYRVWGVAYRGDILVQAGEDVRSARLASACFTLSSNYLQIIIAEPKGGKVKTSDNETTLALCGGEFRNPITFVRVSASGSYCFALTNSAGVVRKILNPNQQLNVNGLAPDTYRVWGLAYGENLSVRVGDVLANATGCHNLSENFVELVKPAIVGGTIAEASGQEKLYDCTQTTTQFNFTHPETAGSYSFLVVNAAGAISAIKNSPTFRTNGMPNGTYKIYGLSHSGAILAKVGDKLTEVTLAAGCYDLSDNFITVIRGKAKAGDIALQNPQAPTYFCPDEEGVDEVIFKNTNTLANSFRFVVTNEEDKIQHISASPSIAFSEIGTGIFRVYGVASFNAELALEEGDDLQEVACMDVSDKFITVVRQDAIGGRIQTTGGAETVYTCPSTTSDKISFQAKNSFGEKSAYILTNVNGFIIGYPDTNALELASLEPGEYRIYHLSYTGTLRRQMNKQVLAVPHSNACYGLSDNFLLIYKEAPVAGLVATSTLETTVEVCTGADNFAGITMRNSSSGRTNYAYIITDEAGKILALPQGNVLNFDAFGNAKSRVYGVAFTGTLSARIGQNITNTQLSNGCAALSLNFVTVIPKAVEGGTIFSFQNERSISICGGDGKSDYIGFYSSSLAGANYSFIITDENNVILRVMAGNLENFDVDGPVKTRVWGVSFMGTLKAVVGQKLLESELATGCYALSENHIEIVRTTPNGGQISTAANTTEQRLCVTNNGPQWVKFKTNSTAIASYRYVLTNTSNVILATTPADSLDLKALNGTNFRVYGVSFMGTFKAEPGDNVLTSDLSSSCFSVSSNFVTIHRTKTDAGRITLPADELVTYTCPIPNTPDFIGFFNTSSAQGADYRYVITNRNNVILRTVNGSVQDFNDLGEGIFRVWGVSFTGNFTGRAGDEITGAVLSNECYSLTENFVTINRATAHAGKVTTTTGAESAVARVGNLEPDIIVFTMEQASNSKWRFIVTDNQKKVVGLSEAARFDFEGLPVGFYRVYGIAYTGNLTLAIGDNLDTTTPSDECFDISDNFVRVTCALNFGDGNDGNLLQQSQSGAPIAFTHVKLWPNPASDNVELSLNAETAGVGRIQIFDSIGKLVYDNKLDIISGVNRLQLNIQTWPSGMYHVLLSTGAANTTTSFVKQKL